MTLPVNPDPPVVQIRSTNKLITVCDEASIFIYKLENDGKRPLKEIFWGFVNISSSFETNLSSLEKALEAVNQMPTQVLRFEKGSLPVSSTITFSCLVVSFVGLTGFTHFTIRTASSEAYALQLAVENEPLYRWYRIEINLQV